MVEVRVEARLRAEGEPLPASLSSRKEYLLLLPSTNALNAYRFSFWLRLSSLRLRAELGCRYHAA